MLVFLKVPTPVETMKSISEVRSSVTFLVSASTFCPVDVDTKHIFFSC